MKNEPGPTKSEWVNVTKFKMIFEPWNPLFTNLNDNKPNQNLPNIFKPYSPGRLQIFCPFPENEQMWVLPSHSRLYSSEYCRN